MDQIANGRGLTSASSSSSVVRCSVSREVTSGTSPINSSKRMSTVPCKELPPLSLAWSFVTVKPLIRDDDEG